MSLIRSAVLMAALLASVQAEGADSSWLDVKAWRATLTRKLVDQGSMQESNTWVTTTTQWTVKQDIRIVAEFQGTSGSTNSRTWWAETNLEQRITVDEQAVQTSAIRTGSSSVCRWTSVPGYNPNVRGSGLTIYDNTYSLVC